MHMTKLAFMGLRLACLMLFVAQAFAAGPLPRTLEAAADGLVTIENTAGSVEVIAWSRDSVEVSGDLGSDVEELVFERDGDTVRIEVRIPNGRRGHNDVSSDLVVKVPEASSVNVTGVSTDVTVSGVTGELRLNSVSGDIETESFEADVDAETVSGDVRIDGNGGRNRSRLSSVSGDIEAHELSGEIQAGTVSGDLTIDGGSFDTVRAETVSGDLSFSGELAGNGRMDVETVNGEVDINFTGDLSARFDIETFNGDIDNCFGPQPQRTSRYAPGRELNFTEGGGSARVTIQTLNGDLTLCKE
jgi:DUF4097 and DUF4098 domain-containing protein YvlB